MLKRVLLPVLALGLGFALLAGLPSPAAESAPTPEKINKLIQQLGSSEFDDRENAQKQLDAIGEPALPALKKATASEDTEIRRRSEELVKKVENRLVSSKLLQPTKLHLVYKDAPLSEAVADFCKKSGYQIVLHDPENKLKDRKVTLDTGETTFWQAFDKFCIAASVTEAKPEDLLKLLPKANVPGPANAPPGGGGGIRIQPANPNAPVPRPSSAPKANPGLQAQTEAPPQPAVQRAAQLPQAAQPGGGGVGGAAARPIRGPINALPPGQITLKDGKPKELPVDYSTAFRVRAMDKNDLFPNSGDQLVLGLRVSPEPKIASQLLLGVTVTKALDDKDQLLVQGVDERPTVPGARLPVPPRLGLPAVGINARLIAGAQEIPVYFKKAEKASKTLKELTGVIQTQVLTTPKAVITTDDVFKSVNKTFRGGTNGSIEILEVTRNDNGQVRVRFEIKAPADIVPVNAATTGNHPVVAPAAVPGNAVPRKQAQPALPQAFQVIQIQAQAQPAARIAVAPINRADNGNGISVIDDKGNTIPSTLQLRVIRNAANGPQMDQTAIFQLPKDQTVAKLVYTGSRSVLVEVPFTLKNVTLP